LIIVFLRFGIATPTEVSVMSTLYALVVAGVVYRDLTWAKIRRASLDGGISTGVVLLIIMASSVVGWIVTYEQLPAEFTRYAKEVLQSPWLMLLAMNLIISAHRMFLY